MATTGTASALARLFDPQSVAIVGASPKQDRYTGRIVRYCRQAGYKNLFLVNPKYSEIDGAPCWPSVAQLPETPDVVVCMAGPDLVPSVYEESWGAAFFLILGDMARRDGSRNERYTEFEALLKKGGPRIMGPQSLGFLSPQHSISLSISSAQVVGATLKGKIGLISQSGGIISAIIDRAAQFGIGFSHMVSTGDEFDLEVADYLEYMIADPKTAVIAIHAESLKDPQRFLAAARRAQACGKAILLLKPGKSAEGMQAAMSHSGRITGRRDVQQVILERHGVALVDDIDDLWLPAEIIARYGPVRGKVGAVSTSGGFTAVVADALRDANVELAQLGEETRQKIRGQGSHPNPTNPIDAAARGVPGLEATDVEYCLKALSSDPNVGVTLYAETLFLNPETIVEKLIDISSTSGKPHITAWQAGVAMQQAVEKLRRNNVIAVTDLGQAARSLSVLNKYAATREVCCAPSKEPADQALEGQPPGPVPDAMLSEVLSRYKVANVSQSFVSTSAEAGVAAAALGFPVVLKGLVENCLHKSELGLVKLKLTDPGAVEAAAQDMLRRNPSIHGFLVQKQISGEEFIVGINNDRGFGSAILLARGGVYAEAADKVALEAVPLNREIAERMIDKIDPKGILSGYRGRPLMARQKLVDLLCSVSALAEANATRIAEVDLNPVIVTGETALAVDAVMVLR
ncbi:acetate--CoA ligase family protein [Mesorhizobium sp. MSK_1335]|uniref:Acetate--CoA ligase family protein n=1 Tax=Mesorhizobium montanum TaxID=3072323 RepID=A0ABU4ZUW9_9HYPH|nr:acetate--CoA ligase family protein [Mesorhizobium sp. MSK_1335]MDX8529202.1 acetate--CoA ligase family protein [Mesorhizobium sp. MSK_1335]